MDSEALATLKLMVSPTAAAQAAKGHMTGHSVDRGGLAPGKVKAKTQTGRVRQQKHSGRRGEQRKMVRFADAGEAAPGLFIW